MFLKSCHPSFSSTSSPLYVIFKNIKLSTQSYDVIMCRASYSVLKLVFLNQYDNLFSSEKCHKYCTKDLAVVYYHILRKFQQSEMYFVIIKFNDKIAKMSCSMSKRSISILYNNFNNLSYLYSHCCCAYKLACLSSN